MSQRGLEQFGACQKARTLFDLVVADMEALKADTRCYRLVAQQVGSADSICANIEEGYGRLSRVEYIRFLEHREDPHANPVADTSSEYLVGSGLINNDRADRRNNRHPDELTRTMRKKYAFPRHTHSTPAPPPDPLPSTPAPDTRTRPASTHTKELPCVSHFRIGPIAIGAGVHRRTTTAHRRGGHLQLAGKGCRVAVSKARDVTAMKGTADS